MCTTWKRCWHIRSNWLHSLFTREGIASLSWNLMQMCTPFFFNNPRNNHFFPSAQQSPIYIGHKNNSIFIFGPRALSSTWNINTLCTISCRKTMQQQLLGCTTLSNAAHVSKSPIVRTKCRSWQKVLVSRSRAAWSKQGDCNPIWKQVKIPFAS